MLIDLDSVGLRNQRIEWIYFNLANNYYLSRTINARNVDGPDSFAINLFSRFFHLNPPLSHSGRWASRDGQHCETLEPSLELRLRLEVLKMRASSQPVTEAKKGRRRMPLYESRYPTQHPVVFFMANPPFGGFRMAPRYGADAFGFLAWARGRLDEAEDVNMDETHPPAVGLQPSSKGSSQWI